MWFKFSIKNKTAFISCERATENLVIKFLFCVNFYYIYLPTVSYFKYINLLR